MRPPTCLALCLLLLGALGVAACSGDADKKASVINPVFGDPCRNDPCADHALCKPAQGGGPMCLCEVGYAGTLCDRCEPGFHTDSMGRCVTNESCAEQETNPCAPFGSCNDGNGVIMCVCDAGYEGPRCTLCESGYGRDAFGECLQLVLGGGGALRNDAAVGGSAGDGPGKTPEQEACAKNTCNGRGACTDSSGAAKCSCEAGYAGEACASCVTGYHRDGLEQCVVDETCTQITCGTHGTCDDASGVIDCNCAAGYAGERCADCGPGFHVDGSGCALDRQCLSTTCAGHGQCTASSGNTSCACASGYTGAHCESCASEHHRDATGACIADENCTPNECGAHGDCVDSTGVVLCICDGGYTGAACASCAAGFHIEGGNCVLDQSCQDTSCSSHAECSIEAGKVTCTCDLGYEGAACGACLPGYYRDYGSNTCIVFDCKSNSIAAPGLVVFDGLAGYPTSENTCVQSSVQSIDDVTLTSLEGDGTVWACAASPWVHFPTKHAMVEAGATGSGKLVFDGPITKLSFDYGAYSALSLQLLADGKPVGNLTGARRSYSSLSLTFDAPITVLELRSASGGTNTVALDNIAYEPPVCP